ncbi:MAG: amino acid permease [Bryobacteraceae bacterium]
MDITYLKEAWGPLWGFLCGWTSLLVARSGATAAVAAGFSIYFSQFVPMSPAAARALAAILILALTLVNYRGVRLGAKVQNVFTGLKLLGLLVLIGSTILGSGHAVSQPPVQPQELSPAQFGSAMLACIFSYNGWLAIGLVGGEIKDPQRNLPRAIILGVGVVTSLYMLANIGYLRTLTIAEIATTERVAEAAAARTMGSIGSTLVTLTILASTFGTTNSNVMTGPRLNFAQARDGFFPAFWKNSSSVPNTAHRHSRNRGLVRNPGAHRIVFATCLLRNLHLLDSLRDVRRRFDLASAKVPRCAPTISHVRVSCYASTVCWIRWRGGDIRLHFRAPDFNHRIGDSLSRHPGLLSVAAVGSATMMPAFGATRISCRCYFFIGASLISTQYTRSPIARNLDIRGECHVTRYLFPDKMKRICCAPHVLTASGNRSGLVGIAQVAMHRREHVVVIRPGATGIVLHTMFYENEVRRENEYRTDISLLVQKELDLALLLINSLTAPFEAAKYRDSYREKLDVLIAAKLEGKALTETAAPRLAPVVNILEALQRSLDSMARRSVVSDRPAARSNRKTLPGK